VALPTLTRHIIHAVCPDEMRYIGLYAIRSVMVVCYVVSAAGIEIPLDQPTVENSVECALSLSFRHANSRITTSK